MFQPLLPRPLALGSRGCFYDCSGFGVNKLKFHLSGAPCICQHILQIESWAGPASTHLSHRLSLIGSSPRNPSPQDRESKSKTEGERGRVGGSQWEVLCSNLAESSKAQRMRLHFISLLSFPHAPWRESISGTLLPPWGRQQQPQPSFPTNSIIPVQ